MENQKQRATALRRLRRDVVRLTNPVAGYEGSQETVDGATIQVPCPDSIGAVLHRAIAELTEIHTNHRGFIGQGEHADESIDGHFDGWAWHAWQGPFIAYGATEEGAIEHLREKIPYW